MIISAEEARNRSKNREEIVLNEFLEKTNKLIESYSLAGVSTVNVNLPVSGSNHKNKIKSILVEAGYKVKFKSCDNWRNVDEYIQISWD
jgi:hypothetical protein